MDSVHCPEGSLIVDTEILNDGISKACVITGDQVFIDTKGNLVNSFELKVIPTDGQGAPTVRDICEGAMNAFEGLPPGDIQEICGKFEDQEVFSMLVGPDQVAAVIGPEGNIYTAALKDVIQAINVRLELREEPTGSMVPVLVPLFGLIGVGVFLWKNPGAILWLSDRIRNLRR